MKDSTMDRAALIAERADLVRQREKRVKSSSPHAEWIAKVDQLIEAIDAQLDAPKTIDYGNA